MNAPHIPVLADQVVEAFSSLDQGLIIDCTAGYGGHASLLLSANPNISYIGIDQDTTAIEFATNRLAEFGERARLIQGRFSDILPSFADQPISGILADIGVSSLQLDDKTRGFGFEADTLDMRMDKTASISAETIVNSYSEADLARLISEYGEEPNAKKIADLIVKNRPFGSAKELSTLISKNIKRGKIHPATLTFQAIRIEVNDELGELKRLLDEIGQIARDGLIVAIISFHSLEDRIVKDRFRLWSSSCICPSDVFRCECGKNHKKGKVITKKPIVATDIEMRKNPRSRSAKLRVFEFGGKNG